jgi:DHA3 family tetracycline resistance protein-like MFS transporter
MREEGYTPSVSGSPTFAVMRAQLRSGLGYVRRSPVLLTLLAVTAIMGASSETFDRLWEARLLRIGLPDLGALPDIGWFGLISAGAMGLSVIATEGARRLGKRGPGFTVRLLATLNTLLMLSVIGFGAAGNFPLALAFYWAAYLLRTVNGPLYAAWLNSHLEPRSRATVFSLNNQADAFGQIAGGPLLGLVANVSLRGAFGLSGLLLLPATILYLGLLRRGGLGVSKDVS